MARLSRRVLADYVGNRLIAGVSAKQLSREVAAFLVDTKRVKELPLLISDIDYYLATKGLVAATVTSAFALSEATEKAVAALIRDQTRAKAVTVTQQTDPTVLGGLKLSVPGRELDNTIARKLTTLRANKV